MTGDFKGDYDETVNKILEDVASGKRIDISLLNHIDPREYTTAELEYYLHYCVDWFMVRHRLDRKEAAGKLITNLRYAAGYFGEEYRTAWHGHISVWEEIK